MSDGLSFHPDWTNRAACRDTEPETFFPSKAAFNKRALRVCEQCPVAVECFRAAMDQDSNPEGVWGRTTKRQRAKARTNPAYLQQLLDWVSGKPEVKKGNARKTHCIRDHEFTAENTRTYRGKRICKTCQCLSSRKHRQVAA